MAVSKLSQHNWKWRSINGLLHRIGYSVIWEQDFITQECRYAIRKGLYAGRELLGIYNDEAKAEAMCNLLLSQAKYEGE